MRIAPTPGLCAARLSAGEPTGAAAPHCNARHGFQRSSNLAERFGHATPRIGSIREMTLSNVIHSPAIPPIRPHLDFRANPTCDRCIFPPYSAYRNTASSTFRFINVKKTTIISGSGPHIEERTL